MRIIVAGALALMLAACGSSQQAAQQTAQIDAVSAAAADCVARETQAIAPQPIDLETATLAVLGRCDYPGVIERSFAAKFPTERQFIHDQTQARYEEIKDSVRRGIAMLRTKGAPKQ